MNQQRVGPIIGRRASKPLISTKYQLYNKLNINSNDPLPHRPVSYRSNAFAKEVLYTLKPKPALVYTLIHSTVTTRSSCGDLLRLDSTCGRSSSLVVRREWAHSPLERLSQNIGAGSVGPSTGSPCGRRTSRGYWWSLYFPKRW
jgi:hypothetical protein